MENKPVKKNLYYSFVISLAGILKRTIMPAKFHNKERLNMDAPYILISNHNSMLDPLYISHACKRYQIRWLGKKEILKMPIIGWFAKKMNMIHIDRHNSDMAAMRQCMASIKSGEVLGIFPEGTRHLPSLMHEVESGTAFIALRAGVPLLPVFFDKKISFFRKAHAYVGEPMDITALKAEGLNTETVAKLCKEIQETFFALRDAAAK